MKVNDLVQMWESTASGQLTQSTYTIQLPIEDAAKLAALAEMYPKRSLENLMTDLLNAALNDIEGSLPYIKGNKVIAEDEMGDPMFEDIGPTPKFLTLTRKHLARIREQQTKTAKAPASSH